ncbi:HAD family phosphatase [Chryseobacterium sp. MEBOG06]|uniref:HAD family hydrolase n=1 Tax=unclassified Chryseobacterium TaxID=2593645 RepID=UPI001F28CCF4|nr:MULTISPECIES: HAD family phosphatase [unclassified Chryseobacterium]UKB85208.1 HAD family phosphatase [Chryseobacterium sp. MEBOG06]
MTKTIIFDLGGVLLDWNPRYFYRNIFKDPAEMEWFLSNICTDDWNLEQDRGRTFEEGISILKRKYPQHSVNIQFYFSQWEKMLIGEIPGTVHVLKELKKKYAIYGLTNWSEETFPIAYNRFDFFKLLDGIVVSGTEKMIKPDKEIFRVLLDRYNLKAEDCLFIDDNKDNIQSASELGFESIHFSSANQLSSVLKLKGVL